MKQPFSLSYVFRSVFKEGAAALFVYRLSVKIGQLRSTIFVYKGKSWDHHCMDAIEKRKNKYNKYKLYKK